MTQEIFISVYHFSTHLTIANLQGNYINHGTIRKPIIQLGLIVRVTCRKGKNTDILKVIAIAKHNMSEKNLHN